MEDGKAAIIFLVGTRGDKVSRLSILILLLSSIRNRYSGVFSSRSRSHSGHAEERVRG